MTLIISEAMRAKLASKHVVLENEVAECFANRVGDYLVDDREEHKTDPATLWFVAETDRGRKLKICFIPRNKDLFIRTAYDANEDEIRIYNKYS